MNRAVHVILSIQRVEYLLVLDLSSTWVAPEMLITGDKDLQGYRTDLYLGKESVFRKE